MVLAVTAIERIGYHQGMDYLVAAMLMQKMQEEEAFALLVFALTEMHLQGFYLLNTNAFLSDYTKAFEGSFEVQLPQLFANFQEQGYEPMFYLVDWFSTMFLRVGGFDLALLVMDLFYAGVDEVLFRVALAILKLLEPWSRSNQM